ncbi:MAG TPA: hypothetical protein EYG03_30640 [Planctomycetes bacterium]|nr:hypothetical protein [Fuerstiella sp.]HIK96322.1 hypothetical protein [Planctomycetota bacterium]
MFFRFAAGLILVVIVSMVGIDLEKQTLEMRRAVSGQYFQKDLLLEMHAHLRLEIQTLTAPSQLAKIDHTMPPLITPHRPSIDSERWGPATPSLPPLPLLRWQHPARSSN